MSVSDIILGLESTMISFGRIEADYIQLVTYFMILCSK